MRFNKQQQIDSLKRSIQALQEKDRNIENSISSLCGLFDNSARIISCSYDKVYTAGGIGPYFEMLIYTYKGTIKTFGLGTSGNYIEKITDEKIIIKNSDRTFVYDKGHEVLMDITDELNTARVDVVKNGWYSICKGE